MSVENQTQLSVQAFVF